MIDEHAQHSDHQQSPKARPRGLPRLLITAGPTHEPIDQVRYLGNRSSGKMGIALAVAASSRQWATTLLLGPTHLEPPKHSQLTTVRFQTTSDLQNALLQHWPRHDVLLMAAAVADYTFTGEHPPKIARTGQPLTLTFHPTPDLLAGLAPITRNDQFTVGFALEPVAQLESAAKKKLQRKQLDAIVANPLETMDADTVSATVLLADDQRLLPPSIISKAEFASWLLEQLEPFILNRIARSTSR